MDIAAAAFMMPSQSILPIQKKLAMSAIAPKKVKLPKNNIKKIAVNILRIRIVYN
jgi:hypothetical protein